MSANPAAIQALNKWFDANAEYPVETVQALIRVPSVNPKFDPEVVPGGEAEVQKVIASRLANAGMEAETYEVFPGRANLYTLPAEGRSLVFNGHVDVVPPGDEDQWTKKPFGGEREGNRVYGRGAMDMKGGIASAITALRALHECGIELDGSLGLHTVVDEEAGGFGTRDLLGRITAPTAVVVNEPSNEEIQIAEGGLEWVRVTIRGRNNHSAWRYSDIYPQPAGSEPSQQGVNAINLMAELIQAVERLEQQWGMVKRHPLLPPGFTTISAGVLRAGSGTGEENLPQLYDNPAMVPDVASIDYDLKFFPGEDDTVRQEFEEFVHAWAQQHPWLREHPPIIQWGIKDLHFPSMDTPKDDPAVTAVSDATASVDARGRLAGFPAVADAAFYSASGSSSLIYGPVGGGLHAPDEWVDTESLKKVARVLAHTAVSYLGTR